MIERFSPSRDGHRLDRLRHTSNRVNRMLRGAGSRAKQWEVLRKEGIVGATAVVAGSDGKVAQMAEPNKKYASRQLSISMKDEDRERFTRLRDGEQVVVFVGKLLDAYEQRRADKAGEDKPAATSAGREQWERMKTLAQLSNKSAVAFLRELLDQHERPTPIGGVTTEAANILGTYAAKLGTKTQLDTLCRLVDSYEAAKAKTQRIRDLEVELRGTGDSLAKQADTIREQETNLRIQGDFIKKLTAANVAFKERAHELESQLASQPTQEAGVAVPQERLQDIAFGLIDALTGTTAVLDPSGEIVVTPPEGAMVKLFDVWRTASRLLGFGKK